MLTVKNDIFSLRYMSELELPAKRGTFVEFRTGLINVCPVGRSCSYDERLEFAKFDQENNVRLKFKEALEKEFGELGIGCQLYEGRSFTGYFLFRFTICHGRPDITGLFPEGLG